MRTEAERFRARADDGRIFTVIGYAEIVSHTSLMGAKKNLFGSIDYELDDGRDVSATSDPEVFKIVETDQVIRKF